MCEPDVDERCHNGAACRAGRRCSAGGRINEGEILPSGEFCGFGLRSQADFTAEPLVYRCGRVCDTDAHCRSGERCVVHTCQAICTVPPNLCAAPNRCVDYVDCVNERRFARIDCDGDMDLDAECSPGGECDPDMPGSCRRPAPGTE